MSGEGGNTTGFLQSTKHSGAREKNAGKQSKSGGVDEMGFESPVGLECDAISRSRIARDI